MRSARLLTIVALVAGAGIANGQPVALPGIAAVVPNRDGPLGIETVRLWQARAPQANSDNPDEVPMLTLFRTQPGRESGTAVIVAPGGGYVGLADISEGRDVASWFTAHGITAFVLRYRVGAKARLPIR